MKTTKTAKTMETYQVQVTAANFFEDIYVEAASETEAIEKAKKLTTIKSKFVNFIV